MMRISSLVVIAVSLLSSLASAAPIPITASGWNRDVVFEAGGSWPGGATPPANGYAWFETGSSVDSGNPGLPVGGAFVSANAPNPAYQLAPYTGFNMLHSVGPTDLQTLTLSTPGKFESIYVLSVGGGGTPNLGINYTLNFSDSSTTSGLFNSKDWTANGGAISPRLTNNGTTAGFTGGLHDQEILFSLTDQAKTLESITFVKAHASGYAGVFALSGVAIAAEVPEPSTLLLAAIGLLGSLVARRRRSNRH